MNSNKEKVGESSDLPELLGQFHWAELLYQCKLGLRVAAACRSTHAVCCQSTHSNSLPPVPAL